MADVRKAKSENSPRPRTRQRAAASRELATSSPAELKRLMLETQDQLSLIHGVLEELCERQEALSAWQMEFSKRLVTLQEAQWRSLEDLAGVDMGDPVGKTFGVPLDGDEPESESDQLDEANKLMDQINADAMSKRAVRMRKRKDPLRPAELQGESDDEISADDSTKRETPPESVFVIPPKIDVH